MKRLNWLIVPMVLLLGCQRGVDDDRALRAASIANDIAQNPQNAHLILAAAEVDPVEYQEWLYDIAADPEATALYLRALQFPPENPYIPDAHSTPRPKAAEPPGIRGVAP